VTAVRAEHDPAAFDARIEELTRALEASSDVNARESASELVGLVLQFHRIGLERLVHLLSDASITLRLRATSDPVVAALLALHELEPPDTGARTNPQEIGGNHGLLQIRRSEGSPFKTAVHLHDDAPGRCELCGADLGEAHHHYVDLQSRRLSCSCRACWLLSGSRDGRESLRRVPDRYAAGPAFRLNAAQWDALQLPVAIAFFMFNSAVGRTIAFYPSPAGPTESALPLAAWHDVEQSNPWVRTAAPDVEAILVRRHPRDGEGYEAFIVPIDACYDLVGRIRVHWRGFDGGDAVREEIDRFFSDVAARSTRAVEPVARSS
jgi:hypothetical protein